MVIYSKNESTIVQNPLCWCSTQVCTDTLCMAYLQAVGAYMHAVCFEAVRAMIFLVHGAYAENISCSVDNRFHIA